MLAFMAYSTYSSINFQLQSSAIGNKKPLPESTKNVSVEKLEKTITDAQQQTNK